MCPINVSPFCHVIYWTLRTQKQIRPSLCPQGAQIFGGVGRQQQKNMISTHEKELGTYQSTKEASSPAVQSEQASQEQAFPGFPG